MKAKNLKAATMVASMAVLVAAVTNALAQGASCDANIKLTLARDLKIDWSSRFFGNHGTARRVYRIPHCEHRLQLLEQREL
jgi:hypothetical protein